MTEKIYYENLYSQEFDADIVNISQNSKGNFEVELNRTLFYPSGGGQPCDLGTINNIEVLEVFERNNNIIHVLKYDPEYNPEIKTIHGVIDWPRRFELMQQHLGEHIFAGCLYNLHQLHTARMRIEGDNVSIDIDSPVKWEVIREAEELANNIIWQNIPVEILYPDNFEEVKKFARKLPPENAENIRIVKIKGVDYVPCCGLHVKTTGEVGLIKIVSSENHKGGTRIYLKCGKAAYRWLNSLYEEVRKAENELVCGYSGINEKILILKNQIHDLKSERESLIIKFLKPLAENLKFQAENFKGFKIISHVLKNSTQEEIKHLFNLLTNNASENVIALLASETPEGIFLIFGCNRENKKIDVRSAFKESINLLEGKGGGPAFCAQGWGKNKEKTNNAIEIAENIIKNSLK